MGKAENFPGKVLAWQTDERLKPMHQSSRYVSVGLKPDGGAVFLIGRTNGRVENKIEVDWEEFCLYVSRAVNTMNQANGDPKHPGNGAANKRFGEMLRQLEESLTGRVPAPVSGD